MPSADLVRPRRARARADPRRGARRLRARGRAARRCQGLLVRPGRRLRPAPGVGRGAARRARRRVVLTVGGLQGFVFYAAEQLARAARARARRGAELRPAAQDPRARGRRDRRARDGRRGPRSRRARRRARSRDERPSFLYTIPTFQNPSGRTLSAERRARLVEVVREHELAVLEDDPYGLVRFEGDPEASLARARGRRARHVHVLVLEDRGSRGSQRLLRPSRSARGGLRGACSLDVHLAAVPPAGVVAEFIARGNFEPNLEHVRAELRARRDAMLAALAAHAPAGTSWSHPAGRLLRLARARRRGRDGAGGRRRAGGGRIRPRPRLLRGGLRRRSCERPLRVQLRDARADHRGRRALMRSLR